MEIGRETVLKLYRNLLKESKNWNSYNYRMYALRKIRHEFQENKTITDTEKLNDCFNHGLKSLEIIKRQVAIGNLYLTRPLVIETQHHHEVNEIELK
ncbi:LYR motif-containing protein 4 [Leptopilina heterotoma]|uniref:LYR motif-containing protein 4 n=1 Tax=Leptopilina heterotoma TaxID=63436 RepID=UPI001CA91051|nr:LYR motif-containing protein 4 [Leptopilina heterotoma]